MRRLVVPATAIIALVLIAAPCFAAGKYCLAFWREWGYYEKGGTGGAHVMNVHVWDENGAPLSGKQITTGSGTPLGTTDARGQVEIDIWAANDYDFKVSDGGIPSDVTPVFTTRRMPDWGHYSWECGFLYKSDVTNPGTFDLDIIGTLNSTTTENPCLSAVMSAPRTESVAFYSCRSDPGYYCTDPQSPGGAAPTLGQTFKASGNRVVACKVHVLGGYGVQYIARIRQGGSTGAYVGAAATSPVTGEQEYAKTLTR